MNDLIKRIEAYMQANPYNSRNQMMKDLGTNLYMLKKLEKQGVRLPLRQSYSAGGTKSRAIAMKAGKKWATWSVKS